MNLAGVLAFGLILYLGGVDAWRQIARPDWGYVLAALAVTLLWNLVAAYRWSTIADPVTREPERCPFRYYFTYHMIGMMTGQVVPITVGMLGGRPVALSLSREVPLRRAALSVLLDKIFDLTLALLLVLPAALFLIGWNGLALTLGLMVGIVAVSSLLIGWRYEQGLQWLGRLAARLAQPLASVPVIGQRLIRRLPDQLQRLSSQRFVTNRLAVQAFLLTLVMYSLLAARLFFVAQALRLDIPWYLMVMGVCVAQLTLIFAVTPGSLGFLEAGWGAVLGLAGLLPDQIVLFLIARRAYMLVFTAIGTLSAFAWIRESPAGLFRAVLSASRRPSEPEPPAP
jgi:uncharacterized protein (TIRG00374 family)